jgi:aspartyl-tRNA(Asn)/glutamyl-tRNA(Gln) amidotransferase subunit C
MALTIDEVRKIAALSRLELTPDEEQRFLRQLGEIVDYIDQLRRFQAIDPGEDAPPALEAADLAADCLPVEVVLDNAPQVDAPFLVVPAVKSGEHG